MGVILQILDGVFSPFEVAHTVAIEAFAQLGLFLIPLIFFLGICSVSILTNQRFEKAAPTFFLSLLLVLYIFSLFGQLVIGFFALVIIIFALVAIATVGTLMTKSKHQAVSTLMTPGALFFVVLGLLVVIINSVAQVNRWDEFTHWAISVKEMFRLDDMYVRPDSALSFIRDYPPGLKLIQYFGARLSGGYSEPALFISLQLFILSFILPLFASIKKFDLSKFLICLCVPFAFFTVLPFLDAQGLYNSLYSDIPLGIVAGFAMLLAISCFFEGKARVFLLFATSSALVLIKEAGLIIAVAIIAGNMLYYAYLRFRRIRKDVSTGLLKESAVMFAGALFAWLTWTIYCGQFPVSETARGPHSGVSLESISAIFLIENASVNFQIIQNFFAGVLLRPILTFPSFSLALYFIIALAAIFAIKRSSNDFKLSAATVHASIMTGTVVLGFAFFMGFAYLVSFPVYEAIGLAGFTRYMSKVVVAVSLLIFALALESKPAGGKILKVLENVPTHAKKVVIVVSTLSFITVCLLFHTSTLNFLISTDIEGEFVDENHSLFSDVNPRSDKVFLLYQGRHSLDYYMVRYYLPELQVNQWGEWWITTREFEDFRDLYSTVISPAEFGRMLISQGYDYVWIGSWEDHTPGAMSEDRQLASNDAKEDFIAEYGSLFQSFDDVEAFSLFLVEPCEHQGVNLVRVNID